VTIVSNALPLIGFARLDQLDLLQHLYGELVISEVVWREVVIKGAGQPGADRIDRHPLASKALGFDRSRRTVAESSTIPGRVSHKRQAV
jgi:hypothetical protein